jgi:hypothetical protein
MSPSRKRPAGSVDRSGPTDALAATSATAGASARGKPADPATRKIIPAPGAPRNIFDEDWLPKDGLGFAESLHRSIDLVSVADDLLRSDDDKMKQRVLEQILELAYGKTGRAPAEPTKTFTYQDNEPSAIRDREIERNRLLGLRKDS